MNHRIVLAAASALAMALGAAPALADNDRIPPGDPCGIGPGVGTGNPCNGNEGNEGDQGNSGHGNGGGELPDFEIPPLPGHGAFITQIGDYNDATVPQTNSASLAIVWQDGDDKTADVTQHGTERDFGLVNQFGQDNQALVSKQEDHPEGH